MRAILAAGLVISCGRVQLRPAGVSRHGGDDPGGERQACFISDAEPGGRAGVMVPERHRAGPQGQL